MWTLGGADDVRVSESVRAHASEYQSHSRHRHIQCDGLEMMDMCQLEQDFNVPVWVCGQPETNSCSCHVKSD
ncbi:hypothetical protein Syun_004588 [Stephania yunnanensis]|uniref:Uncharacterized protein n=1 Tax=Stephania yunnanensis TaxID=152371 RepID=A0AAP0L3I3_9MAGN